MSARVFSTRAAASVFAALVLQATTAGAVVLEDSEDFEIAGTYSGADLGVPGNLGAIMFSDDGDTLYVVGNSEASSSALYAVAVTRDAATDEVTGLGPAASTTLVFSGSLSGLDTGLEVGPSGTLFYTYWNANYIGQRPGGFGGAETLYNMAAVNVPSSVAGLTFSPHAVDSGTGFGQMQISSWSGANLYNIPLTAAGGGLFTPGGAVLFATLPQQGTGAIQYVPSGKFEGHLMYVNWDYGEVRVLQIDAATGLPIDAGTGKPTLGTANPVDERFASDLGVGPWGLEFDARTRDFFVSTWGGNPSNSIIHFTGYGFSEDYGTDNGSPEDGCGCRTSGGAVPTATLAVACALVGLRRRKVGKRRA